MKHTLKTLLIAATLVLPVSAYAEYHEHGERKMERTQMCKPGQECPMADKMVDMQKQMGGMMERMHKMMGTPCDASMKKDMGDMMKHMKEMHSRMGKMMGGKDAMIQDDMGKKMDDNSDHELHHPKE